MEKPEICQIIHSAQWKILPTGPRILFTSLILPQPDREFLKIDEFTISYGEYFCPVESYQPDTTSSLPEQISYQPENLSHNLTTSCRRNQLKKILQLRVSKQMMKNQPEKISEAAESKEAKSNQTSKPQMKKCLVYDSVLWFLDVLKVNQSVSPLTPQGHSSSQRDRVGIEAIEILYI